MTASQWTGADIERFRAAWHKAVTDPRARRRTHRLNLRRNLPRKARIVLLRTRLANSVFIWLCRTPAGSAAALRLRRL